jgi:hypothetical protein
MTDFLKGSIVIPPQSAKTNLSKSQLKGTALSNFDVLSEEAARFIGNYYDSGREEEYLFWMDEYPDYVSAPVSPGSLPLAYDILHTDVKFAWSRNDNYLKRFNFDSKNQKWRPLAGSNPINLGQIISGKRFSLNPTLLPYAAGNPIYFDKFFAGSVPKEVLVPVVIPLLADGEAPPTRFDPGVDLYITEGNNEIVSVNPIHLGKTLWYNPISFQKNMSGVVGHLQDKSIFISPIPAPTETPLIRIGFRKYLDVKLTDSIPNSWSDPNTCYVNTTTGELKLHVDLKNKHNTDKSYYNNEVFYDGIRMGYTSTLCSTVEVLGEVDSNSGFYTDYYKIDFESNKPKLDLFFKDSAGKISAEKFLLYAEIICYDSDNKETSHKYFRVDDDDKFKDSTSTNINSLIEDLADVENYCFLNYQSQCLYFSENIADEIEGEDHCTIYLHQISFTPLSPCDGRIYSKDLKQTWKLTSDNNPLANKGPGVYSTKELVASENNLGIDRGYLYYTFDSTPDFSKFVNYSDYLPYSELGIFPFQSTSKKYYSDSSIYYSLDNLYQLNPLPTYSLVEYGKKDEPVRLTEEFKNNKVQFLDYSPAQDHELEVTYADKEPLNQYEDFLVDYSNKKLYWCESKSIPDASSSLRTSFTFNAALFSPSLTAPFSNKPSSVTIGASSKLLFPMGYSIPDITEEHFTNLRYSLNSQTGVISFNKNLNNKVAYGYSGSYTNKLTDLEYPFSLTPGSSYYLKILSGSNRGFYILNSDGVVDPSTPIYNSVDQNFSWEIYEAYPAQELVKEFYKTLNYVAADPRIKVYITQSLSPDSDFSFLKSSIEAGSTIYVETPSGSRIDLKLVETQVAGSVGFPLPEPASTQDIYIAGSVNPVTFESLKSNTADLNKKVLYITKVSPTDFYYEPVTGTLNIPPGLVGTLVQVLDLTNTSDISFNSGMGEIFLTNDLTEGQTLNLDYFDCNAANIHTGVKQTAASNTKNLSLGKPFFRPSFKIIKNGSGIRNYVSLAGKFSELQKGSLLVLEDNHVVKVDSVNYATVDGIDYTNITLSQNFSYEVGSRSLSKCFGVKYFNNLAALNFKQTKFSPISHRSFGSKKITLADDYSLYALENSILEISFNNNTYYHLVQSVDSSGSIILKSPLNFNFPTSANIKIYYTPVSDNNVNKCLWLTPDADSYFLDTGLSSDLPKSLILFSSYNVAGRELLLSQDYNISGNKIIFSNDLKIKTGQKVIFLHNRSVALLPGVPFNATALIYTDNPKEGKLLGKPLYIYYTHLFPDTYQSQIQSVASFAANLDPTLTNTGPNGNSGPPQLSGGSTKPSGNTHYKSESVWYRAKDRAAREKLAYLNTNISSFEQILELLSGRFVGGVDGKFKTFTGKTLRYPIPERYEDPVSGEIRFTKYTSRFESAPSIQSRKFRVLSSVLGVQNNIDDYIITGLRKSSGEYYWSYRRIAAPSFYSRLFSTKIPVTSQLADNGAEGYGFFDTNGEEIGSLSNYLLGPVSNIRKLDKLFDEKPFGRLVSATFSSGTITLIISYLEDNAPLPSTAAEVAGSNSINDFLNNSKVPVFPGSGAISKYSKGTPYVVFFKDKDTENFNFNYVRRHVPEYGGFLFDTELYLELIDSLLIKDGNEIVGQKLTVSNLRNKKGTSDTGVDQVDIVEPDSANPLNKEDVAELLNTYTCVSYAFPFVKDSKISNLSLTNSSLEQGLGATYIVGSDIDLDAEEGSLIDNSFGDVSYDNPTGYNFFFDSSCPPPGAHLKGLAIIYPKRIAPLKIPALNGGFLDDSGQDSNKFIKPTLQVNKYFKEYHDSLKELQKLDDEVRLSEDINLSSSQFYLEGGGFQILDPEGLLITNLVDSSDNYLSPTKYYQYNDPNTNTPKVFLPAYSKLITNYKYENYYDSLNSQDPSDYMTVIFNSSFTPGTSSLTLSLPNALPWQKLESLLKLSGFTNTLEVFLSSSTGDTYNIVISGKDFNITKTSPNSGIINKSASIQSITVIDFNLYVTFTKTVGIDIPSENCPFSVSFNFKTLPVASKPFVEKNHILNDNSNILPDTLDRLSPKFKVKLYNGTAIDSNYDSIIFDDKIILLKKMKVRSEDTKLKASWIRLTAYKEGSVNYTSNSVTGTDLLKLNKDETYLFIMSSGVYCLLIYNNNAWTFAFDLFNQKFDSQDLAELISGTYDLYRVRRYSVLQQYVLLSVADIKNSLPTMQVTLDTYSTSDESYRLTSSHKIFSAIHYNLYSKLIGSYIIHDNSKIFIKNVIKSGQDVRVVLDSRVQLPLIFSNITLFIKNTNAPLYQSLLEVEADLFSNKQILSNINTKSDSGVVGLSIENLQIKVADWDYALVETKYPEYISISNKMLRNFNIYQVNKDTSTSTLLTLKNISYESTHLYQGSLQDLPGESHTVTLFKKSSLASDPLINYYFFWLVKLNVISSRDSLTLNKSYIKGYYPLPDSTSLTYIYDSHYISDQILNIWLGSEGSTYTDSSSSLESLMLKGTESYFYTLDKKALGLARRERFRWVTFRTHRTQGSLFKS